MKSKITATDKEVQELLRHVSYEQLMLFSAGYASLRAGFKTDILAHFRPGKDQKSKTDYQKEVAKDFNIAAPSRYYRHRDYYAAAREAANHIDSLLEKAKFFAVKNNFGEAAAIAQSIIEAIPRNYEEVDDSNCELADSFSNAVELLLELAENKSADRQLKKEIFHWVSREVKEKIYADYGFDEIQSLLIPYTNAAGMFPEAVLIVDKYIRDAPNDYSLETAVMEKITLLRQNNHAGEAEKVVDHYIGLEGIRGIRVKDLLKKKHYERAIITIKDGIKLAEKKKQDGSVTDWKDQLLEIYINTKDHDNIRLYSEDLFYNGDDPVKYYHILKQETRKESWAIYLDTLLSRPGSGRRSSIDDYTLAEIYVEEQYWDRLLLLVEKVGLHFLEYYEKYLKSRFPGRLLGLLVQHTMHYAEQNMGRHHYENVARLLKKIRTYPGGNVKADKLLADFRMRYKQRRAMMEELKRV